MGEKVATSTFVIGSTLGILRWLQDFKGYIDAYIMLISAISFTIAFAIQCYRLAELRNKRKKDKEANND